MLNPMDFSVVIPSYCSEHFIGRAIESCIVEGIRPDNIFVVEDGVFDNTSDVVLSYERINLLQLNENHGAPHARNYGLERVKSEYVMFLDADDYIEGGLAKDLYESAMESRADMAFGPWRYGGDGRNDGVIRTPKTMTSKQWLLSWLNGQIIPTCSVLWKTSLVKGIGGWDESLRKNQDGELMARAFLESASISYAARGNSVYWQHDSPNRISSASAKNRLFTSEVIYSSIIRAHDFHSNDKDFLYEIGRFCCKTAWFAEEGDDKVASHRWMERARSLNFTDLGYNQKSSLMANLIGLKRAARMKMKARPFFSWLIQR